MKAIKITPNKDILMITNYFTYSKKYNYDMDTFEVKGVDCIDLKVNRLVLN